MQWMVVWVVVFLLFFIFVDVVLLLRLVICVMVVQFNELSMMGGCCFDVVFLYFIGYCLVDQCFLDLVWIVMMVCDVGCELIMIIVYGVQI